MVKTREKIGSLHINNVHSPAFHVTSHHLRNTPWNTSTLADRSEQFTQPTCVITSATFHSHPFNNGGLAPPLAGCVRRLKLLLTRTKDFLNEACTYARRHLQNVFFFIHKWKIIDSWKLFYCSDLSRTVLNFNQWIKAIPLFKHSAHLLKKAERVAWPLVSRD